MIDILEVVVIFAVFDEVIIVAISVQYMCNIMYIFITL